MLLGLKNLLSFFFFFFRKIFVIQNREDSHAQRWSDRVESGGVGQSVVYTCTLQTEFPS